MDSWPPVPIADSIRGFRTVDSIPRERRAHMSTPPSGLPELQISRPIQNQPFLSGFLPVSFRSFPFPTAGFRAADPAGASGIKSLRSPKSEYPIRQSFVELFQPYRTEKPTYGHSVLAKIANRRSLVYCTSAEDRDWRCPDF